jgi:hypothetical protein
VKGWFGFRDPFGDHGGTPGFSTIAGSLMSFKAGLGNFSDNIKIRNTFPGAPADFMFQVKFRRCS